MRYIDDHRDKKKKLYLAYLKERDEIIDKLRSQPYVKLDKPYYHGWKVLLDFKSDIKNRKDSDYLYYLIEKGYYKGNIIYNQNHVKLIRKKIYFYYEKNYEGKLIKHTFFPGKRQFSEKEYNEFSEKEKTYYYKDSVFGFRGEFIRYVYKLNLPSYYFVLKCKSNLVTEVQGHDPLLYQRKAELDYILDEYWRTSPHNSGWNKCDQERENNKLKREHINMVKEELKLYKNEK